MSDQPGGGQPKSKPARTGSEPPRNTSSTGSAAEQVKSNAKAAESRAAETAASASREAKEVASDIAGKARQGASDAMERMRGAAEEQKAAGAERVKGIAGAIARAADELDEELPQAADYVRRAGRELETLSETVRQRDIGDLLGTVQDFARRQPTVFLGATTLAGFAAVRFLMTSARPRSDQPAFGSGTGAMQEPRGMSSSGGRTSSSSGMGVGAGGTGNADWAASLPAAGASAGKADPSGDPGGVSPEAPGLKPKPSGSAGPGRT